MLKETLVNHIARCATRIKAIAARFRLSFGLQPLSFEWGHDRGLSLCRYYLEEFLKERDADIHGHCLEFEDDRYTTRFGGSRVTKLDILHKEDDNPNATIVADLTASNTIPSDQFDCIICTHVLHHIIELNAFISELHRILKPGGVLLVAVPHVSMCEPAIHELLRFTPEGLFVLLKKAFEEKNVNIQSYGNSLTAAGQIRGLVAHEFTKRELDTLDPRFAVDVCARAIKQITLRQAQGADRPPRNPL